MTAGIGKQGVPVIKGIIDIHADPRIRWRDGILETGQSEIRFILYIGNDKTKLKANGVTLYPLHIYLMNMKKKSTE